MIVLSVVRYNAAPSAGPSASFDELGGTIGRADNNQLVLPDPERMISRVHARVLFRNGSYVIVDNGSNPISVNGRELGSGREQALKPGDEVEIGGYALAVSDGRASKSNDPFADLFGDGLALAGAAPAAAPRVAPMAAPAWPAAPAPSTAKLSPSVIPEDWDPFAPDPELAAPAVPPVSSSVPLADMVRVAPAESSIDDLFNLGAAPHLTDPLARAMPTPAAPPNTAAHADPLAALNRAATAPPATLGDLGSELNTPMPLPPSQQRAAGHTVPPTGAVFSWDEPLGGARVSIQTHDSNAPVPQERVVPPAAVAAAPAMTPGLANDALRQALLEGLDVPSLRMDELTPQAMHLIGQLLREATRGAVELLVARAALKREVRANVTMIVAKENNPLKFSPSVDVALQHLLGPSMAGFLPSAAAMRDAFDDLRAHQLGVMAGMRAALQGVLQRFDPAQLEAKLEKRSSLANLIPSSRKARLWELFQELFTQLESEAQDDFEELFGNAFLRAYEDHIDRLREDPGPR